MRSKFNKICWLLFACGILFSSLAHAGWKELYFKPFHLVTGRVEGQNVNGRSVSISRGTDSMASTVANSQYYFNAYRLPGISSWAPVDTLNAEITPDANGYQAERVSLSSTGNGVETMPALNLTLPTGRVGGSQIIATVWLQGYYDHLYDPIDPDHNLEQRDATLNIEARQAPAGPAIATAQLDLNDHAIGQNGFGQDLDGEYYLVIRHLNHLPVITSGTVTLRPENDANGQPILPAQLDMAATAFYQEQGFEDPLITVGEGARQKRVLRGGDIDASGNINSTDLQLWIGANGSDISLPRWEPRIDCNGDNYINSSDLQIWILNNGKITYVQ